MSNSTNTLHARLKIRSLRDYWLTNRDTIIDPDNDRAYDFDSQGSYDEIMELASQGKIEILEVLVAPPATATSSIRTVATISARNALVGVQNGESVMVLNATEDPTVDTGYASYLFKDSLWTKLSEQESMDTVTVSADEKVKLNALDPTTGYLEEKVDSTTIQISGGKLAVKGIEGVVSTVTEFNHLAGVTSNVQAQINAVSLTEISAANVIETSERQFISAVKKAQIDANVSDLSSHSTRLTALETAPQGATTDEKVKLNASDLTEGYLGEKIDGVTIQVSANKLAVKGIEGVTTTITELNQLAGVTSNVQAQINALTSMGNFTGSAATYADIGTTNPTPAINDMVIVVVDETKLNESTIYVYSGTAWVYSGKFTATVRDFATSPLNLGTETTGTLSKTKVEKQNASETPITDAGNNFTAVDVEGALTELFQYANGIRSSIATTIGSPLFASDTLSQLMSKINTIKADLAQAITDKGVTANTSNTLMEMTNKVKVIPIFKFEGIVKKKSKLNITAPYAYQVTLTEPLTINDIATTVLQFVGNDSGIVRYNADYNNGDASNFTYDTNQMIFDGFMNIKDKWELPLTEVETNTHYESANIDFTAYADFGGSLSVDTTNKTLSLLAIKNPSVIAKANGDISLAGVETLDAINLTAILSGNGESKAAISFNGGVMWSAYTGTEWVTVNVNDLANFKTNGMTKAILGSLTNVELSSMRNASNIVRFAYYLERPTYSDVAKNDKIQLVVTMTGHNVVAPTSAYSYAYDEGTKTLTYTFNTNGTYTMNYVDGM